MSARLTANCMHLQVLAINIYLQWHMGLSNETAKVNLSIIPAVWARYSLLSARLTKLAINIIDTIGHNTQSRQNAPS